ncbi:hypothetical protein [Flavilitoribacter nigricans]|uniref:Lipocalin-like domain-containing protein n=1 Tax=Flavilitoribacter nigricans (strain ATCC 23147 / DSM 23189 / NBRC 102662 / NCIMB 1420 / SS-2) TaxID=1122177 RepID=A0A2D0NCU4_FLAN2|nr:hypothetical protein [Flavilitoribacter nigricans]PHN06331.1 hypothetical protein CRP01_12220 [Flavilitoribacter nigricans DSM 23189 = NBRC 102662]
MKRLKTYTLLLLLFSGMTACGNDTASALHQHVQGFWKVHQIQQNGESNDMYAEINDSIILYWYDRSSYIFPYGYRIEDNQLVVWLQNDSLSRPKAIGTLSVSDADHFTLVNDGQRLEYQRVSFDKFEEETGRKWKGID